MNKITKIYLIKNIIRGISVVLLISYLIYLFVTPSLISAFTQPLSVPEMAIDVLFWLMVVVTFLATGFVFLSIFKNKNWIKITSFILMILSNLTWIVVSLFLSFKDFKATEVVEVSQLVFCILFILIIVNEIILVSTQKDETKVEEIKE